jgi:hypothetical protein
MMCLARMVLFLLWLVNSFVSKPTTERTEYTNNNEAKVRPEAVGGQALLPAKARQVAAAPALELN